MKKSRLGFVFNAHLPFVRHPEYSKFLEEDWLFESINESYIPLLRMMFRLKSENIPFRLTFSLSPSLCSMLSDNLLRDRFVAYMESHIELGQKEIERLDSKSEHLVLAKEYTKALQQNLEFYLGYDRDILKAFNELSNAGCLELITTCATHAYLPAYKDYPVAVNAQIETGALGHFNRFEKMTEGFWLPECGYYPGLEDLLARHNIKWISLGTQALTLSKDKVLRGCSAPVRCQNGLYCFARDYNLTHLVWSATDGYPTDPDYREFYRDIGYDLPMEYIRPYIHEPEVRVFTGFKYWAITGKTADKVSYIPEKAAVKSALHAANFLYNVKSRTRAVESCLDLDPFYTLSFDAELFGHWWYEGVSWLENVIRLAAKENDVSFMSPSDYINEGNEVQILQPSYSSWGDGGFSQVWVDNGTNAWAYRHTFKGIERIQELAVRFADQKSLKQRFLNQAAREALLMMASDWPFIIHNHSSEEYARKRLEGHIQNLDLVYDNMCKNAVNTEWLVTAEKRNNIFPDIDYNIFNPRHIKEPSPLYTTEF